MSHRLLVPTLLLMASCAPKQPRADKLRTTARGTMAGEFLAAPSARGVYVRASFDTDPSLYVGRFIKDGDTDINESRAMELTCSQHITTRVVSAGGVIRDEYFMASTSVAASLGIPPVAYASAGAERGIVVRVRYTENRKMMYDIADAAAFEACCRAAPDQCTDTFIGEFIGGTGKVFYADGTRAELEGGFVGSSGMADLEVKDGRYWRASLEFPNDVYFAFRTTDNIHVGGAGGAGLASGRCDAPDVTWDDVPPASSQGKYFVGVSKLFPDEQTARDDALRDARSQAVRHVQETVDYSGGSTTTFGGSGGTMSASTSGGSTTETSASGVAEQVKDLAWCNLDVDRPTGGTDHQVKVVVFVPGA